MDEPRTCDAYTTRKRAMARGAQEYRSCTQPASQARTVVEHTARHDYERTIYLCPRHVGMFDKGNHGILERRA